MKTTEIPAIIDEAKNAGCANDTEIHGYLAAEISRLRGQPGETSDGFHTFNELYAHRHALFLALMESHPKISWVSELHDDGTSLDGWFIAGMNLPTGTISYHLPVQLWSRACDTEARVLERAPKWDGHTSADVVKRLADWIPSRED